ncbi:MAG: glycosyltransferase [Thermomicrobia bacterium]|nr:glycosyltransferase [Thermomicrobia bacterium]
MMRVLFTTQPGEGHFHWLVPIARALGAAGHDVAVACAPAFRPTVGGAGLRAFPCGLDWLVATSSHAFRDGEGSAKEPAGMEWLRRQAFVRTLLDDMLNDLLALRDSWMPDLVVREAAEYAGCVAAEYWGVPHAVVGRALGADYGQRGRRGPLLAAARTRLGLPPDPDVAMPYRYLQLLPEPPSFHPPDEPLAPTAHFVRPGQFDRSGDEGLPQWVTSLPDQPTVHATLGTVMGRTSRLFDTILDALHGEPVNLILTVGRTRDPETFGPQPTNVHIARYIPHSLLLPHCEIVITQGSINTVMTALSHGLPLVLLPLGGDQPANAARCAALGVGRALSVERRTPEAIRDTVRAVLRDARYRRRAEELKDEMRAMPGVEYGVTLLDRLAREQRPLVSPAHG